MMRHSRPTNRAAFDLLAAAFLFLGCVQTSSAQTLEQLRGSVTIERLCQFGREVEIVAKEGDVVRLTFPENPSGRTEFILLPKGDTLEWRFPYVTYGMQRCSTGGRPYDRSKNRFFGIKGTSALLNLKVSEGADNRVTIRFLLDDRKNLEPRLIEQPSGKVREEAQRGEEGRSEAEAISVDERLAGLARLWSEVKYNFAFFDQVPELDWDRVLEEYLPRVRQAQTTEEYYRVLEQCVAQLKDGHTTVYPPESSRAQLPVRLTVVNGKPVVSEVAAAGAQPELKPGLEITHIDGRAIAEILQQDVYPYVADSTPQNRDRWAFRRLIQGASGSEVTVRLRNADGKSCELRLTHLEWRFSARPPSFEYYSLGEGIAYVALNSFASDEAAAKFKDAFPEIRRAKGLIIDVRNNGGGSSSVGEAVTACLIDKPIKDTLWKTRQYTPAFRAWGREEAWHKAEQGTIRPGSTNPYLGPVIVLTGSGTVSAAEDFVVPLHASGRATLVGEKTAGTTGQPLLIQLPGGGKARICTKRDSYPDGREFVGVGVIPDVEVHPTQQSIAAGRDAILEKGVEVLAKQAGISAIDPAVLAAKVVSQRRRRSAPEEGQGALASIFETAEAEYSALIAARAKTDWVAMGNHADGLGGLFKDELLPAFDVEDSRKRLEAQERLNQQAKYTLLKLDRRKKEIETLCRDGADLEEFRRLIVEIEDLSDEIHDRVRDKRVDQLTPRHWNELEKRWKLLRKRISESHSIAIPHRTTRLSNPCGRPPVLHPLAGGRRMITINPMCDNPGAVHSLKGERNVRLFHQVSLRPCRGWGSFAGHYGSCTLDRRGRAAR